MNLLALGLALCAAFSPPDRPGTFHVSREPVTLALDVGPVRSLLYRPLDASEPDGGVVLGHGFLAPIDRYDSLARRLASHGFAVIIPGYADIRMLFASASLARDLLVSARFLDSLGCRQTALVGHSMGGGAAWAAAEQAPDGIIAAVAVLSPYPVPGSLPARRSLPRLVFAATNDRTATPAGVRERFFARAPAPCLLTTLPDAGHNGYLDHTTPLEDRFEPFDRTEQLQTVRTVLTAFLRVHLTADDECRPWLATSGAFEAK